MKKRIATVLCLCLLVCLGGCAAVKTIGWQTVTVENCGTLKLPADWTCYEKDGLVYILDGSQRPVMIQTKSSPSADGRIPGDTESNEFFSGITNLEHLTSAVLSNGAIYGTYLTDHNGKQSEKYSLMIGYDRTVEFLVWDETMDEAMLKTIAGTFEAAD